MATAPEPWDDDAIRLAFDVQVTPDEARLVAEFREEIEIYLRAALIDAWQCEADRFERELLEGTGGPSDPASILTAPLT